VEENVSIVLSAFAGFLSDFGPKDAPQAKAMAERALAIERGLARPVQLAGALLQVGRADLNLGHFDAADSAFREALALADSINQASLRAHILFRWGELALARGELPLALTRVEQARVAYEAQGNRHRLVSPGDA
jgi:tetratricopeptide (TPR) repeat protein